MNTEEMIVNITGCFNGDDGCISYVQLKEYLAQPECKELLWQLNALVNFARKTAGVK